MEAPEPATAADLRSTLFTFLLFFLNLQLDGFRLARSPARQQLLLLPFTLVFCATVAALLFPPRLPEGRLSRGVHRLAQPRSLRVLTLVFLLLSLALFIVNARFYKAFGYHLHLWATAAVFLATITAVALAPKAKTLATATLASFTAISLLSIVSFPLNIQRSDMLPLLLAAGRSLLTTTDPYHLYTFPTETVFLTYLPGTLLAYLPATLLHIDPRLLNLLFVLALALTLLRNIVPIYRDTFAALLSLWLLSPYLLYRHELYTQPHWLATITALLLLARSRLTWAAILFGISISLSQFSWVLFPFFLLFLRERHGTRAALLGCLTAITTAAVITLPFLLWGPHPFVFGVLSHWSNTLVSARPVNLSFWTATLVGSHHLQLVQALLLAALFAACVITRSCRTFPGLLRSMSIALTVFILWNILVWGYFFLLLELLLLLYLAAAKNWLSVSSPTHTATNPTLT